MVFFEMIVAGRARDDAIADGECARRADGCHGFISFKAFTSKWFATGSSETLQITLASRSRVINR
jgi:hypothetical protein